MWFPILCLKISILVLAISSAEIDVLQFLDRLPFLKRIYFNDEDVRFSLVTPQKSQLNLFYADLFIGLDNSVPLKFIVHGWGQSPNASYFKDMTDAYFSRGNYNIIHVNWSIPASVRYRIAAKNTMRVGIVLGKFIARIHKIFSIELENIHIIGHSLGAHVAGVAGQEIYKTTGNKIGRITGLDPAGPLFRGLFTNISRSLDKNDAEMVDIVHTDGKMFGYQKPVGRVDFYPNGGVGRQPGCPLFNYTFCSHHKSFIYYTKSITSKNMLAVKCDSWKEFEKDKCGSQDIIVFGEDMPLNAKGRYYFKTDDE